MNQFGYGSSPIATGATNPQWVRQQMAQNQGQPGYSQMLNQQAGYGTSTFGQFGTNPQMVRQHIQEDLAQTQYSPLGGYNQSSGQLMGSSQGGYQPMQNQAFYNPAVLQEVMSAVQSNPQQIRQQIQQDIQYGQQRPSFLNQQQQFGGMSQQGLSQQRMAPQGINQRGFTQGGLLSQFGTNPQVAQQHIREDLQQQQQYGNLNQGFTQPQSMMQQGMGQQGMMHQGGMLSQFATNPQMVQQHIREDLAQQAQYGQGQSSTGWGSPMQQQMGQGWGSQAYYS